jgi:hypothetical protein
LKSAIATNWTSPTFITVRGRLRRHCCPSTFKQGAYIFYFYISSATSFPNCPSTECSPSRAAGQSTPTKIGLPHPSTYRKIAVKLPVSNPIFPAWALPLPFLPFSFQVYFPTSSD